MCKGLCTSSVPNCTKVLDVREPGDAEKQWDQQLALEVKTFKSTDSLGGYPSENGHDNHLDNKLHVLVDRPCHPRRSVGIRGSHAVVPMRLA